MRPILRVRVSGLKEIIAGGNAICYCNGQHVLRDDMCIYSVCLTGKAGLCLCLYLWHDAVKAVMRMCGSVGLAGSQGARSHRDWAEERE